MNRPCSHLPSPLRGIAFLARLVMGIQIGDEMLFLAKDNAEAIFPKLLVAGHPQLWGREGGARVTCSSHPLTAAGALPLRPGLFSQFHRHLCADPGQTNCQATNRLFGV